MNATPCLSLIINTFDQPEYLGRVLSSVSRQSSLPDEVLLADDGSGDATRSLFAQWAGAQSFQTEHIWQPHQGFRRSRVLNEAIARAQCEYVIFLDGDTIPHPRFLADHRQLAQPDCFVQGHRALIQKKAAVYFGRGKLEQDRRRALLQLQIRAWQNAFRWPRPWCHSRADLRGIRGCNLAIWRDHLIRVNGYDEAFTGWGREDSELAVRLMNSKIRRLDVRGWALCYHLWHPTASRADLAANDRLLAQAQQNNATRSPGGLDQHFPAART